MKKILLTTIFLFLFKSMALAQCSITLAWDANTEPDLAGYKIYWGSSTRNYNVTKDVGNVTQITFNEFVCGSTYYFAATAYDFNNNESDYSDELIYTFVEKEGIIKRITGIRKK